MATKTISLSLDSYERLRAARRHPKESFSSVLRRAKWDDTGPPASGAALLEYYRGHPEWLMTESDLETLDERVTRGRTSRAATKWES